MSGLTREQAAALGVPAEVLAAAYPGGLALAPAQPQARPASTLARRSWTWTVEGQPVPKGRPRVTDRGTITPKRTREYEARVAEAARACMAAAGDGPARLSVLVWTETRRRLDLDNVLKAVADACVSAGAITDDTCHVLRVVSAEWMGVCRDRPRIEVTLEKC